MNIVKLLFNGHIWGKGKMTWIGTRMSLKKTLPGKNGGQFVMLHLIRVNQFIIR